MMPNTIMTLEKFSAQVTAKFVKAAVASAAALVAAQARSDAARGRLTVVQSRSCKADDALYAAKRANDIAVSRLAKLEKEKS